MSSKYLSAGVLTASEAQWRLPALQEAPCPHAPCSAWSQLPDVRSPSLWTEAHWSSGPPSMPVNHTGSSLSITLKLRRTTQHACQSHRQFI